jgi:hypothetical protein
MAAHHKVSRIIKDSPFETTVVEQEAAWLDQIDLYAKARGKSQ